MVTMSMLNLIESFLRLLLQRLQMFALLRRKALQRSIHNCYWKRNLRTQRAWSVLNIYRDSFHGQLRAIPSSRPWLVKTYGQQKCDSGFQEASTPRAKGHVGNSPLACSHLRPLGTG